MWWHTKNPRWQWWREAVPVMCPSVEFLFWREGQERAAFEYELARRSSAKALQLPTFPELTPNERDLIVSLFGISDNRWVSFSKQVEHTAQCPNHWNLKETPSACSKVFKRWFEYEQAKRGYSKPKNRPQNKKPVQWNWFDLLDAGVGQGDDTGRSIKSKALRRGQRAFARLCAILFGPRGAHFERLCEFIRRTPVILEDTSNSSAKTEAWNTTTNNKQTNSRLNQRPSRRRPTESCL